MSSGEKYDPERDPNWEYQGRTPQQVGQMQLGFAIFLGAAAILIAVAAVILFIEQVQHSGIAWPLG